MNNYDIIKTKVLSLKETPRIESEILKHMEEVGRIAYRSEDKITETSAKEFVERMLRNKHLSVLEHSNICIYYHYNDRSFSPWSLLRDRLIYHPYVVYDLDYGFGCMIGGSYRAWLESIGWYDGDVFLPILQRDYKELFRYIEPLKSISKLQGWCLFHDIDPSIHRYTATIQCDRGISHEIVRHRVFSFLQESTRYVNYNSKSPSFICEGELDAVRGTSLVDSLLYYDRLIKDGESPQMARDILPNMLATKLAMTGTIKDYLHFIRLRKAKNAHPRIQKIALELESILESRGLL